MLIEKIWELMFPSSDRQRLVRSFESARFDANELNEVFVEITSVATSTA